MTMKSNPTSASHPSSTPKPDATESPSTPAQHHASAGRTNANRRPSTAVPIATAALVTSALLAGFASVGLLVPDLEVVDSATLSLSVFTRLFGETGTGVAALALGTLGVATSLALLLTQTRLATSTNAPRATYAGGATETATLNPLMRIAAVAMAVLSGIGLLGFGGIAVSGYLLATLLPLAALVGLVLLGTRRPVAAVVVGAVAIALAIAGTATGVAPIGRFFAEVGTAAADSWAPLTHAFVAISFTAAWGFVATRGIREGRFAGAVLRARVPITIAAAACALPYVIARISWLTPWPLFGSPQLLSEDPIVLLTGLALGTAMLIGAILTLGLISPWGERLPRWMGAFAGRPVAVQAAVVPALIVAALFTFGGFGLAIDGVLGAGPLGESSWTMGLILPFWLWGPLLALATWGYRMHREREAASVT